jgi:glycosyltransferase involved in cell wall biosynthesis
VRVHVVVPQGFDDPGRPSGGNIYDQRVCAGLSALGWDVQIVAVTGAWPAADRDARSGLAGAMAAIPAAETVLIDGLIASPAAVELLPHARRLRLIVLLHMPLATALDGCHDAAAVRSEEAVLAAAVGVVVTSEWTRRQVLNRFSIAADRIHVARPGADRHGADRRGAEHADTAPRRSLVPPVNGHLLCVAALAPHKGQDVLVEALSALATTDWECVLVGPLDRDPDFVHRLRTRITRDRLVERVRVAGVLTGAPLQRAYAAADLLVVPSRSETYGMVVIEALAHGLPVFVAAVGGLPEALGCAPDGSLPGTLFTPDDPAALASALTRWQRDEPYRRQLRTAASQRRSTLPRWEDTVRELASALDVPSTDRPPRSSTLPRSST